jgi:hypothetical protein
MKLQLHNAVIEKVQTMADGSIQVRLGMPELPPEEMVALFTNINRETKIIEVEHDPEVEGKSSSQRLRNVLYVLWQQSNKQTYPEFEVYYKAKMERIINQIKDKLI